MKNIHISWRITAVCFGFLTGIALSVIDVLSFASQAMWLILGLILLAVGLSRPSRVFLVLAACAGLSLGLWRGTSEQQALKAYEPLLNKVVSLKGQVIEDVSHGDKGDIRLQLKDVHIDDQPLHGKVWMSIDTKQEIKRSDTIIVRGKLGEGFGNIPASMSGADLIGLQATSKADTALRFRDWFANGIRRAIPEPQASLGSGFLVGQHASLPGELEDQLKIVGLTHAVVASGSNLTLLVGVTRRLFLRISKYTATLSGGLMTAGFILITGLSPSMTRAGLVTGLSLAAWYYGRRIHPMVLLPLAATITTIATPAYVWGDIGWYLSFGAFAGVLILAPLLQHYFWGKDYKPNIMMEILIGTTAAQVATMPVILFSFGTYSTYALIANLLVLPLVPIAMLLTFIAGIAGVWFGGLAHVIGAPASWVMKYMTTVIDWVANLPGAQGEIGYATVALITSYGLILLFTAYMWRITSHSFSSDRNILIGERN